MDKFDRELQRYILACCVEAYPAHTTFSSFSKQISEIDDVKLSANIIYLKEHELLTIRNQRSDDPYMLIDNLRATQKGIDFMLNDGGLSAMLNIQTIRIHRDTITALEDIIALSNLPEPEKAGIVSKLQQLPSAAIEHLTKELVVKGALSLPAALPLIQKFLFGG
ncbi:TPA: hypothetical protein MAD82_000500 [Klebsiella pneumoniae]|nr:hypothetical protein [Klebsiella variicola]HBS2454474.1 hypothetical protein [Klebsiella pneumoniae]HBS2465213.1 hypothetical protein [Klebsiella pneumoniae]HBS2492732.1 hypothetical protein [Klebsiella pneumoniae]HBS2521062.1 hypothetical protein [Klebsiella pneumoniae]